MPCLTPNAMPSAMPTTEPRPDLPPDPHRPADAEARAQAQAMLAAARHAVLAVLDAEGWPMTSRIAMQTDADGAPLALLSGLALHTAALTRDPRAALLIDEAAPTRAPATASRGSPLTRPRLSVQVRAEPLTDPTKTDRLRALWRARDPKAAVYLGLPDFRFWLLVPQAGLLNAGFGRAFRLTASDLITTDSIPPNDNGPAE